MKRFSINLFRVIFTFVAAIVCIPVVHAGDLLWRLTHSPQDVLALVEIVRVEAERAEAKPYYVLPQSTYRPSKIDLDRQQVHLKEGAFVQGKKYLVSLHKITNGFIPEWGLYEIEGESYADAKLVGTSGSDAAALEWFIHSG